MENPGGYLVVTQHTECAALRGSGTRPFQYIDKRSRGNSNQKPPTLDARSACAFTPNAPYCKDRTVRRLSSDVRTVQMVSNAAYHTGLRSVERALKKHRVTQERFASAKCRSLAEQAQQGSHGAAVDAPPPKAPAPPPPTAPAPATAAATIRAVTEASRVIPAGVAAWS